MYIQTLYAQIQEHYWSTGLCHCKIWLQIFQHAFNWTLGRLKQKKFLARLDNFYVVGAKKLHKNRLITKSSDAICAL